MPGQVDVADLRAQIELQRQWREDELRQLKNLVREVKHPQMRLAARKALVVMLYAHFEGLTKAILGIYVQAVNSLALPAHEVHPALAASALSDVFAALRNPNSKCRIFARVLPDDNKLHRFARDREFIERAPELIKQAVAIDVDLVVDTESNLKPAVLKKLLYQVGLDPSLAQPWESTLHELVRRRNDVAHGTAQAGITAQKYEKLESAVRRVLDALVREIMSALGSAAYQLQPGP